MPPALQPDFQASVTPALIALVRGNRQAQCGPNLAAAGVDAVALPTPEVASASEGQVAADQSCFRRIVLRRDGARPLVLRGLQVWRDEAQVQMSEDVGHSLSRHVALYVTAQGACAAQLIYEPGEAVAARPVYRATIFSDGVEFARFISDSAPELCFIVAPERAAEASEICFQLDMTQGSAVPAPLLIPSTDCK